MEETTYVEQYKQATMYLKVLAQDVQMLHHNVVGPNFIANHEALADIYNDVAEILDGIIEMGMTIGIFEPSIEESLQFKASLPVRFYSGEEAFKIVSEEFSDAINLLYEASSLVPNDIRSKIEEYQGKLRIWGLYKAQMLTATANQ